MSGLPQRYTSLLMSHDASGQLGLSKATLYRRQSGGQSRAEVRETQQLMTNAEESALAHWLTETE